MASVNASDRGSLTRSNCSRIHSRVKVKRSCAAGSTKGAR